MLIAQTIAQLRTDAHADDAILTSLTTILNGEQKPDFLEKIAVTEINLGEDFPIFSNCRVHPVEDEDGATGGRLQARMDVDLSDFITLGIETTMVLNYPRPRTAVLPVALSVSVVRFSGTLSISFIPATNLPFEGKENTLPTSPGGTSKRTPTTLAFSFLPNYTLSLSTRSLLGARSRLQDVPKIAQLVESRLRNWFEERCVSPRMQQIIVPNIWPRMKNVVESGEAPQSPGRERREDDVFGAPLSSASALRDAMEDRAGVRWRGATGMGFGLRGRQDLEERRAGDRRSYELNMPGGLPGMLVS